MIKQFYLYIAFLLISTTIFAQHNLELNKDSSIRGQQIIKYAQKAIGTELISINSFSLKVKVLFDEKITKGGTEDEVKVILPNKINLVQNTTFPNSTAIFTSIWNGEKHRQIAESEFNGERTVNDITYNNSKNATNKILGQIEKKVSNDNINKVASYKRTDPKETFYREIWKVFFGLTLIQPFEQNLEFKYAGKAKSGNVTANVVDVKSQDGKTYRLLFDSETNYLLMIIHSYKGETAFSGEKGVFERKYYYSNREKVGDLLIPKKIKVEYKFTPDGKEPRITYENIEILEFKLNPELKESLFEIK